MKAVIVYVAAAIFAAALVDRYRRSGPPFFRIPETIQDHVMQPPRPDRDAIVVCEQATYIVPRGASVTVLLPSQAPNYDLTLAYTALGMMPRHRVLLPRFDRPEKPQFVITVREPFAHPEYEHYSTLEGGWVYRLRQ